MYTVYIYILNVCYIQLQASHSKGYKTNTEEHFRFQIFNTNKLRIAEHNERFAKGEETYELGISVFSDMVWIC